MRKRFKKIYLEITNVCNLNCDFCPKTIRKSEFMSFDLFKKIILETKYLCEEFTLHLMGEPLLHPNFSDIINFAQKEGVKINLTTNGTLIENKFLLLINPAIRRVNFSIHGLKSNYSDADQIKHLKKIIEFTKFAQKEREDLIVIYRLWNIDNDSNKSVLETIEKEFDVNLVEETKKISAKIKNNAFIHFDNSFDWPNPKDEIRTDHGYCHGLSTHIGILCDGTVVPCCLDNNGNIPLGNIKKDSIENILNSKKAVNMKKGFQNRILVEDMCKKCTFIKRLERNRDKK